MTYRSAVGTPLTRRRLLAALVVAPLAATMVAACGDDTSTDRGEPAAPTTDPATTPAPAPGAIEHPTDPAVPVVRVETGRDGFMIVEAAYAQLPVFVVSGDGTLVRPGPQIEIYPQPLLPALETSRLTEEQIQSLLALADEHGLLAPPPDYDAVTPPVADAGSTIVTLGARGETFVHRAFALGMEEQPDEARSRLAAFVEAAAALVGEAAAAGGEVYTAAEYAVGWMEVDLASFESEIEPRVVPWPEALGAMGEDCVVVDGAAVTEALATADQLTFFTRPGATDPDSAVRIMLRPLLPGSDAC